VSAPERVDDRIHDRRARSDRARLARALHAERIGLAWNVACLEHEVRRIACARHRIVHEAGAEQLTGDRIVGRAFHQRLPDALNRPAMHLAGEQQRVERGAEIVNDDVIENRCRA